MVQPQNQIRILPPGTLSIKKRQTLALSEGENVSNGVTEEKKRDNKSGMSGAKFVSSESLSREGKNKECNLIKLCFLTYRHPKMQKQLRSRSLLKTTIHLETSQLHFHFTKNT